MLRNKAKHINTYFILMLLLGSVSAMGLELAPTLPGNENVISFQDATLISPLNGATGVSVNTAITWTEVSGVAGYIISLGTSPDMKDLLPDTDVGLSNTYIPVVGLPGSTTIYVSISLVFSDGPNILCPVQNFTTEAITVSPMCSILTIPETGATNVPVDVTLLWSRAFFAEGYRINVGTAPGATDIVNNLDVGNVLSYVHPGGLPELTTLYVTIEPYNTNGSSFNCREENFTTGVLSPLPTCTRLISPLNGAIEVSLGIIIEWLPVDKATGYFVTIGTSEFDDDVLSNFDNGNSTSLSALDLSPNITLFITITPYNDFGRAIACVTENFSTLSGCGPFIHPSSGTSFSFGPELSFPDRISICTENVPFIARANDIADGYRWFQLDANGSASLLSSTSTLEIFSEGNYRLEAFDLIGEDEIECAVTQDFVVVASEPPIVENINVEIGTSSATVSLEIQGNGDYDFALNDRNGPYQDTAIFDIDVNQSNTVFIRDRNGCGITERFINTGIPNFFTPNGDTYNDFWGVPGAKLEGQAIASIRIFNRFGQVVANPNPQSRGWDGNYQGNPMPPTDYWYTIELENGKVLRGHFALIRR